jgi:hypothetical protein
MTTLLRFIDLRRVFARMQDVLQLRYLHSRLRTDGELCLRARGLRQQVTLHFQGCELTLRTQPGAKARVFTLTQADLFKLITGYGTFAELPLGQLDGRIKALLEVLFPRGKCTFWPNDKV